MPQETTHCRRAERRFSICRSINRRAEAEARAPQMTRQRMTMAPAMHLPRTSHPRKKGAQRARLSRPRQSISRRAEAEADRSVLKNVRISQARNSSAAPLKSAALLFLTHGLRPLNLPATDEREAAKANRSLLNRVDCVISCLPLFLINRSGKKL